MLSGLTGTNKVELSISAVSLVVHSKTDYYLLYVLYPNDLERIQLQYALSANNRDKAESSRYKYALRPFIITKLYFIMSSS